MLRKLYPLVSHIWMGSLRTLDAPYRVVHRWIEGKGKMQGLSRNVEIDGMYGWFLMNSAKKGMFLPSRFADIDHVVRIVE